jgi:hypothetical protein
VSIVHERGRGIAWRIWPAAHVLTDWLQTQKSELFTGDKIFIEIGAGVGLVGLVSAALGGFTALTDLADCLDALHRSRAANHLPLQDCVRVLPLTFGNVHEIAQVVQTMRREFSLPEASVVVLGSDLVYFESLFVPLAQTMAEFCWKFEAEIFLAYKKRIYKNEKRFFHKILPQHGLDFDVVLETSVHEVDGSSQHADGRVADADDASWNTRVFRIKKAASGRPQTPSEPAPDKEKTTKKPKKGKVPCNKEKHGRIR